MIIENLKQKPGPEPFHYKENKTFALSAELRASIHGSASSQVQRAPKSTEVMLVAECFSLK